MIDSFKILPGKGVGNIRLGMKKEEVEQMKFKLRQALKQVYSIDK